MTGSVSAGVQVAEGSAATAPPVRVRSVALRDFRNIARTDLAIPDRGLVLVGQNGHGKTNLLEALHYAHALRSMRGARDQDMIRFGAEAFFVGLTATGARVDAMSIGVEKGTRRKRLTLDGAEAARVIDALGAIPSVVLSPRDVVLVSGAPQERRRFLDIVLAATSRRYLTALQRYRAALVRRNAVLRDAATRPDASALVGVWEPALAEAGAALWMERLAWVRQTGPRIREICSHIGEPGAVGIRYHTTTRERLTSDATQSSLTETLAALLAHDRQGDQRLGLTRHGPHRDDLTITLDGRVARAFASAGQQRTIALAMRLVEAETLRDRLGRDPVLLLDDPFAELDLQRARGILDLLRHLGDGQRILAVPRPDDVPDEFTGLERRMIVHGVIGDA